MRQDDSFIGEEKGLSYDCRLDMEAVSGYTVKRFQDEDAGLWDRFLEQEAVNGTFLQSRRFLNYHPRGRFQDASYLILDKKGHLAAVLPAAARTEGSARKLLSHPGSTYGGLVIGRKYQAVHKIIEMLVACEAQWHEDGFTEVEMKMTPRLLSQTGTAETLDYAAHYLGYEARPELDTYIDYGDYQDDVLKNLSQGKRTNVHNCLKAGLKARPLETFEEVDVLHHILQVSLSKFHKQPVHTAEELWEFKTERLKKECGFFGIFLEEKMLAGAMMFYFEKVKTAHTQYLCALPEYAALSPMSFLYYSIIAEMKKQGYRAITFGVSTEDYGKILNFGLTRNKEAYGGKHCLEISYRKEV